MRSEFDRRCGRLRKQVKNAISDLSRRNDNPFINRSGKKILGPYEAELNKLRVMANTEEQKAGLKKLADLVNSLSGDWFGKAL